MTPKPATPSRDPTHFDRGYAKRNADPDCFKCEGNGWFWLTDLKGKTVPEKVDLLKAIGAKSVTDQNSVSTTARICPYCFDSDHNPRSRPE